MLFRSGVQHNHLLQIRFSNVGFQFCLRQEIVGNQDFCACLADRFRIFIGLIVTDQQGCANALYRNQRSYKLRNAAQENGDLITFTAAECFRAFAMRVDSAKICAQVTSVP